MGKLLGIGQVLWDVVADVSAEFLEEFAIPEGDGVFMSERQAGLFEVLNETCVPEYFPGGCSQNSIGVFQQLAKKQDASMLISCVGNDPDGARLEKLIRDRGTRVQFLHSDTQQTGKIAVMLTEKERAFCVALGAATEMSDAYIDEHWEEIESYECIYTTSHDFKSHERYLLRVARNCATTGQLFSYNLSSVERMPIYLATSLKLLPMSNILFGNEKEFFEFAKLSNTQSEADPLTREGVAASIVERMALGKTTNPTKIVVMTCGPSPVIVGEVNKAGKVVVHTYTVPALPYDKIVDFNGAGDAFVGGFLYGLLHGKILEKSVELGVYCAQNCIQRKGCSTFLDDCPLVDDDRVHLIKDTRM